MKRKLLLMAILLAILVVPLKVSFAFDAFLKSQTGWLDDGNTVQFAKAAGVGVVLFSDTAKHFRVYKASHFFHAQNDDNISGAGVFMISEKGIPLGPTELIVAFGYGGLYTIKDDVDQVDLDVKTEVGVRLWKEIQVAVGYDWIVKEGPDAQFYYVALSFSN